MGGTASTITGGKFANGAVTGAFSRALNDEVHYQRVEQAIKRAKLMVRQRFQADKNLGENANSRLGAIVRGDSDGFYVDNQSGVPVNKLVPDSQYIGCNAPVCMMAGPISIENDSTLKALVIGFPNHTQPMTIHNRWVPVYQSFSNKLGAEIHLIGTGRFRDYYHKVSPQ